MSEAIIVRKGFGKAKTEQILITEMITINTNWIVPKGVVNNQFSIRLFGGGQASKGGYGDACGGSGGQMNNNIINLNYGEIVPISIGSGGTGDGSSGGTTSFGSYIYATGGSSYSGGGGGGHILGSGGDFQFGGGEGHNGGIWGGGGGGYEREGGNGGTYGGGGGGGKIYGYNGGEEEEELMEEMAAMNP